MAVKFDRHKCEFVGLDDKILGLLRKTYPGVDIDKELKSMSLWLMDKGKDTVGTLQFIKNWLNRSHIRVVDVPVQSSLDNFYEDYVKDIWKKADHIISLNRMP